MEHKFIMKGATKRSMFRWIRIVFSIPIIGYIYSPFEKIQTTSRLLGLSSFLYLCLRDFGCGKAISFDDLFRRRSGLIRDPIKHSHENEATIRGAKMSAVREASTLVLATLLTATPTVLAGGLGIPFGPVPVDQRSALARRLKDFANAFREEDWTALYDLASDVNKKRWDGQLLNEKRFVQDMQQQMKHGDDWYRLLKFTPVRTEKVSEGQYNVYGCGEYRHYGKKERTAVAVRAIREQNRWFFTAWNPNVDEPCSGLNDSAWKAWPNPQLDFLCPAIMCDVRECIL
jgi:hypothetical protein